MLRQENSAGFKKAAYFLLIDTTDYYKKIFVLIGCRGVIFYIFNDGVMGVF